MFKEWRDSQAGPVGLEEDNVDVEDNEDAGVTSAHQPLQPSSSTYDPCNTPSSGYTGIQISLGAHAPANTPAEVPHSTGVTSNTIRPTPQTLFGHWACTLQYSAPGRYPTNTRGLCEGSEILPSMLAVLCSMKMSAPAVQNLQKAKLLTTGREWSLCTTSLHFWLKELTVHYSIFSLSGAVLRKTAVPLTLTMKSVSVYQIPIEVFIISPSTSFQCPFSGSSSLWVHSSLIWARSYKCPLNPACLKHENTSIKCIGN